MNVSGGEHLTLSDLTAVGEVTREVCDLDDDMLISGMVVDPELGDKVQVTLVATGLKGKAFHAPGHEKKIGPEPQAEQPRGRNVLARRGPPQAGTPEASGRARRKTQPGRGRTGDKGPWQPFCDRLAGSA